MNQPTTEADCILEYRAPLWRRIVNRIAPQEPAPDDWYALHDQVPPGGDMLHTRVDLQLSWRALLRLVLLGGRMEVTVRVLTHEPVRVVTSHSRVWVGVPAFAHAEGQGKKGGGKGC